MTLKPRLMITAAFVLIGGFFAAQQADCFIRTPQSSSTSQSGGIDSIKAELSRYKSWTLVNPHPFLMDAAAAAACAAPALTAGSPHSSKFVSVYVNDAGRAAMLSQKHPRFPQGSIIVKEKLSGESGGVELATVMIKHGAGYDPNNGDWEYLVMNAAGSKIEKPSRVETCLACHLVNKATDYVSRAYLPSDLREKLR